MAITYPLTLPTVTGLESVEFRAVNSNSISQSPFTYQQQVISFGGERWEVDVKVPLQRKDTAAAWKAFLISLRGRLGTFLMGDPDYPQPRGTISSGTVTGSAGSSTVSVNMTGSLLAGDYFQLGGGSSARLFQVLEDQDGNGDLEIFPKLRVNYNNAPIIKDNPKGVFRLSDNTASWLINSSNIYTISFSGVEVI